MMIRVYGTISLAIASLACLGCELSHLSVSYHEDRHHAPPPPVVYVEEPAVHVCSYDCHDHYYSGSSRIVIRGGHHHGPNCGHHWDGTYWVAASKSHGLKRVHKSTPRGKSGKRIKRKRGN